MRSLRAEVTQPRAPRSRGVRRRCTHRRAAPRAAAFEAPIRAPVGLVLHPPQPTRVLTSCAPAVRGGWRGRWRCLQCCGAAARPAASCAAAGVACAGAPAAAVDCAAILRSHAPSALCAPCKHINDARFANWWGGGRHRRSLLDGLAGPRHQRLLQPRPPGVRRPPAAPQTLTGHPQPSFQVQVFTPSDNPPRHLTAPRPPCPASPPQPSRAQGAPATMHVRLGLALLLAAACVAHAKPVQMSSSAIFFYDRCGPCGGSPGLAGCSTCFSAPLSPLQRASGRRDCRGRTLPAAATPPARPAARPCAPPAGGAAQRALNAD